MTKVARELPADWDAAIHHRASAPQVTWATTVLKRLALLGSEAVVDAGCGTGRLTAGQLELLPLGRVIAAADPPFTLGCWRPNLAATRPLAS